MQDKPTDVNFFRIISNNISSTTWTIQKNKHLFLRKLPSLDPIYIYIYIYIYILYTGGKEWLGFPNLWSGQKLWWNWYLTPVVNFGGPEGPVSQIHSPHLLIGAPGIFRSFKACSDAKERKATGICRSYSLLVKLQPRFLSLQWKTCLWAEFQPWYPSLQWRICLWAEHWWWWWYVHCIKFH